MNQPEPGPRDPARPKSGIWPVTGHPGGLPGALAKAVTETMGVLDAGKTPVFMNNGNPLPLTPGERWGNDYAVGYSESLPDEFLQGVNAASRVGIVGMVQGPEEQGDAMESWGEGDPMNDLIAAAEKAGHPGLAGGRASGGDVNDLPEPEGTPVQLSTALYGPPVPRVPRAAWELPGHPVYDLAKRIFIIDNARLDRAAAAKEWETVATLFRDYAFSIAQGLIREGWERRDETRYAAALAVAAAWNDPGPVPGFHRAKQEQLLGEWPHLGNAIQKLAGA